GLLAVFALILLILHFTASTGKEVVVSVDGKEISIYPLSEDGTYLIKGAGGGTNLLVIESGSARLTEASCPDHLCVHMGSINKAGESIICLPNKVIVEIRSSLGEDTDYDAVVGG
nr:NusG domain II-containing protein [Butyrivibrio sp.]